MSRAVMQQALDALDAGLKISPNSELHDRLRAALSAPEPDGFCTVVSTVFGSGMSMVDAVFPEGTKLYSAPVQPTTPATCKESLHVPPTGELPPLPYHPDPRMMWTKLELEAIRKYGQQCVTAALAAQPAPDGMVLVPKEPTEAMVRALVDNASLMDYESGARTGYRAMLTAAAPGGEE